MWWIKFGIDTLSYYLKLTSKQKSKIMENLKKLPKFYTETSDYCENTYSYLSDCFVDEGVRIWFSRKNGKPWGLLIVVHPTLALGISDRSTLYIPRKKSEYKKIVQTVDNLLDSVNIPCSIDEMKLYRGDITANLIFDKSTLVDEYIRILKKSRLLPHYQLDLFRKSEHKAKDSKTANQHSHKQYCKSAAFFAYDKTAQLEMIDAFPASLLGKCVLRLEAQLRRKGMKKWVGKDSMDGSNWSIIKKLGEQSEKILQWYLKRLQPVNVAYVRYRDAANMIESIKGRKNRERMICLLKKASSSDSLTAALEKLRKEYGLNKGQCKNVLRKFERLGISPITLTNSSDYDKLPSLLSQKYAVLRTN